MSENDGYADGREYATEGDQQLQPEDTLDDRGVDDILDEGYSPPEKWSVLEKFGNTARGGARGRESLDQKLGRGGARPGPRVRRRRGHGGSEGGAARARARARGRRRRPRPGLHDRRAAPRACDFEDARGRRRAGRPAGQPRRGRPRRRRQGPDRRDVGIDGAAASAEEAAVHIVQDGPDPGQAEVRMRPPQWAASDSGAWATSTSTASSSTCPDGRRLLDDVTFRVGEGAKVALVGAERRRQDHPAADRRRRPRRPHEGAVTRAGGLGRHAPVRRQGPRRLARYATCCSPSRRS